MLSSVLFDGGVCLAGGRSPLATRITPFRPTVVSGVTTVQAISHRGPIYTDRSVSMWITVAPRSSISTPTIDKAVGTGTRATPSTDEHSFRLGTVFGQPHTMFEAQFAPKQLSELHAAVAYVNPSVLTPVR